MRVSAIITTYNQPEQLEKVMWGYAVQKNADFELIVADDGSGLATTEVIDRVAAATGLDVVHVWHEDRGFRKTEILNRAVLAATGEYLIFSDGDCIPRDDFVEAHTRLARPGCFLSGGYIKLPREASLAISVDDIKTGRAMQAARLRALGWHPGKRALRLLRGSVLPTILDVVTPTRRTWNGHNSSTWRADIMSVNGFDLDMAYGGLDRALGERLINAGMTGKQVRHRTPCLHLYHERPYVDPQKWKRNHEIRKRIRRDKEIRAHNGIAELGTDESVLIRRPGQLLDTREAIRAVMAL
ncbi:MAG TPA: glycosyltransferase family 2 protein [Gemmatimonadaceae bacterium]|nr:glycosyltransferase family 2 protein [Gemmatimonadaceae bacterium]